jgi:GTPase SAR1 family protein
MSKMITVASKQIKFQIWDTAGQEKYHSLARKFHRHHSSHVLVKFEPDHTPNLAAMYYRGAAAAIVVYDITRSSSFKTLKHWVEELKTKGPKDIAIAIAGNKADLDHMRVRCYFPSWVYAVLVLSKWCGE